MSSQIETETRPALMKRLLVAEEAAIFTACVLLFYAWGQWAWWWFPALLLVPDVGLLGYAFGPRAGATAYNLFHHRSLPIAAAAAGLALASPALQLAGLIGLAHISLDRMLGYGLKTSQGFKFTHLGRL